MSKLSIFKIASFSILFIFLNIFGMNMTPYVSPIDGYLGGLSSTDQGYVIRGWACEKKNAKPVSVDVYTVKGNQREIIKTVFANVSAYSVVENDGISKRCGTPKGTQHGFVVALPYNEISRLEGATIGAQVRNSKAVYNLLNAEDVGKLTVELDDTAAYTSTGWVRGITDDDPKNLNATVSKFANVVSFKGIPYAQPPVGELRWKAPSAYPQWKGERSAQNFGPACVQQADSSIHLRYGQSEDCLTLNIWKPKKKRNLPVIVYIHGGQFRVGTSSLPVYDGSYLASRDVVAVNFNYRVGLFGFFSHPYMSTPVNQGGLGRDGLNFGLADQYEVFKWVKANISAFGGDPNNITIAGSSAGGASVGYWMSNRLGDGLFHKAILESGGISFTSHLEGQYKAQLKGKGLINDILKNSADKLPLCARGIVDEAKLSKICLDEIMFKTPSSIITKTVQFNNKTYHPYLDNYYVLEGTANRFKCGNQKKLPLILGSMGWEASVAQEELNAGAYTSEINWLKRLISPDSKKAAVYEAYGPLQGNDRELTDRVYTDRVFGAASRLLAKYHAQVVPKETFLYMFNYVGENMDFNSGAPHHLLSSFVFNSLVSQPQLINYYRPTQRDQSVAKIWSGFWLNFITGVPHDTAFRSLDFSNGTEWLPYRRDLENRLIVNYYGPMDANNKRQESDGITRNIANLLKERYDFIDEHYYDRYFKEDVNQTCAPK